MTVLIKSKEIAKDILGIIYLHLYGIYAFVSLPFLYLLPGKLKNLDSEIILILGASSGLSKEICRQLVKTKAKLVLWDSDESVTAFAKELEKSGADVSAYEINLSDRSDIENYSNQVKNDIGDVSIIINNLDHAPTSTASFLSQCPAEIEKIFNTNLLSHFWITQHFLPKMIEKNHGHLVAIASQADSWGTGNGISYVSSKCGVRGFMQSLEDEVRHHLGNPDINFTTIFPSFVRAQTFHESSNGKKFRFPALFPVLDDKYVANKVVQGFRRNLDVVYVPTSFGLFLWIERWVPVAFSDKMNSFFILNFDRNLRHA